MYNRIETIETKKDYIITICFQSGEIKEYDFKPLFQTYPIFNRLKKEKDLFTNVEIAPGGSGLIFDDELDISCEELYDNGKIIDQKEINDLNILIANMVSKARIEAGITQKQLAEITKIHQAEISKIERGIGNPSVKTLDRIAKGLGLNLKLSLEAIFEKK